MFAAHDWFFVDFSIQSLLLARILLTLVTANCHFVEKEAFG
jgi:hypothetical protein